MANIEARTAAGDTRSWFSKVADYGGGFGDVFVKYAKATFNALMEPLYQVADTGLALRGLVTGEMDLPQNSSMAESAKQGHGSIYLAARAIPVVQVGTGTYDLTTAGMEGKLTVDNVSETIAVSGTLMLLGGGMVKTKIGQNFMSVSNSPTYAMAMKTKLGAHLLNPANSPVYNGFVDSHPPIISSNSTTGNPAAIARGMGDLNLRQISVLDQLPEFGSSTIVHKSFGQMDLAALTAETGDEFAMFSTGGRRLIYIGDFKSVPITPDIARGLAERGWRWSSHVHPGYDLGVLRSSEGDRAVLCAMGGKKSEIFNSYGQKQLFIPFGGSLEGWKP